MQKLILNMILYIRLDKNHYFFQFFKIAYLMRERSCFFCRFGATLSYFDSLQADELSISICKYCPSEWRCQCQYVSKLDNYNWKIIMKQLEN